MRNKLHLLILFLVIPASIGALYIECWTTLIFDLCVGYLISVAFWLLVVFYPDYQRRCILKMNLTNCYREFRLDVIYILLRALDEPCQNDFVQSLTEHEEFKNYFTGKWDDVLNGLEESDEHLNQLITDVHILRDEVQYVLNNVSIDDSTVLDFFKRLTKNVYLLENSSMYTRDVKYLGEFVFCILAGWSLTEGKLKDDFVLKMIEKI